MLFRCSCAVLAAMLFAVHVSGEVDPGLAAKVTEGHKKLENAAKMAQGEFVRWRSSIAKLPADAASRGKAPTETRGRFALADGSVRVDHFASVKGATILPGNANNNLTEVYMQANGKGYHYTAVSTTGSPLATLYRYSDENASAVANILMVEVISPLNALTEVGGTKITDLLQRPNMTLEVSKEDPELVVLEGTLTQDGSDTSATYILDPEHDYAVQSYKLVSDFGSVSMNFEGKNIPLVTPFGTLPKKVGMAIVTTRSGMVDETGSYQDVIELEYDADTELATDSAIFSETSFEHLDRDYSLVEVDDQGSEKIIGMVRAAPAAARKPLSERRSTGYGYITLGVVASLLVFVVIVFGIIAYRRRNS